MAGAKGRDGRLEAVDPMGRLRYVATDVVTSGRVCFPAGVAPGPRDGTRGCRVAEVSNDVVWINGAATRYDLANSRVATPLLRAVGEWGSERIMQVSNL
jgi:hypothetical protein